MKIADLTVIFVIIMLPIIIVFSEYIDNQITTIKTDINYDRNLSTSTYDAIKAYQLNTINNEYSDLSESKIDDIEAAVNTFFNSLAISYNYEGYRSSVMKEYVPAVVFTMYDGYYIYSPFVNTVTGKNDSDIDEEYQNNDIVSGLKPYVYYSCRYKMGTNYDFVITYTLDNYITIEGIVKGNYVYDYGYLVSGISYNSVDNTYTYDGIVFSENDTELMKEFVGKEEYYYVKIDGTKFYYHGTANGGTPSTDDYIFEINASGAEKAQVKNTPGNQNKFMAYYNAIFKNKSGYVYYKEAYEFTNRVLGPEYNLGTLTVANVVDENDFATRGAIFGGTIQYSDSNFNSHRAEVIKNIVETNLKTAISGFGLYSKTDQKIDFKMPKISETDWELIENNICIISFLQGMSIGGKIYNGYSVCPNNINKEYVDENNIYILENGGVYARVNDKELLENDRILNTGGIYYPGILSVNFERKIDNRDDNNPVYYFPISIDNGTEKIPYYGSYTSIIGSSSVDSILNIDMYRYMNNLSGGDEETRTKLKKIYYTALGRERTGSYNVNNGLKSEDAKATILEIDGEHSLENNYFLKYYK